MVKVNGENIIKSTFPNGEIQFRDIYSITKIDWTDKNILAATAMGVPLSSNGPLRIEFIYESNADITNLLLYKSYLDNEFPNRKVNLIMKFCPYGQADRDFPDSFGTMKYFAKLINAANFNKITIFDPHSPVMTACLDRCEAIYPIQAFDWRKYDLLFYPDNGASKKFSEILPSSYYIYGYKKRDLQTGNIIKYEVLADKADVEGKSILMVDDLVIRGGTYRYAAEALKALGAAKIDLYITHVMPSARDFWTNSYKMYGIDNVFTANTLELPWVDNPEPASSAIEFDN